MSAEMTAAMERARHAMGITGFDQREAYLVLDAALDVEEMARAADPQAFEDHPIELRSRPAALQWAVRRKIATDHAQAIRTALLGADS